MGGIPDFQWVVFHKVLALARERGIRFSVGGSMALAFYTGQPRETKDLDLCVLPEDRKAMIDVLQEAGLDDYFKVQPYDRAWIYRGTLDGVIVDVIWSMANQRSHVDEMFLSRGPEALLHSEPVTMLPAEELIWWKAYVLQHDRCDWPDVLNLIYATASDLNWNFLVARFADDMPILQSILTVFAWLCPDRVKYLPEWARKSFPGPKPGATSRSALLDGRPWFKGTEQTC
jgi:hypothetical protein